MSVNEMAWIGSSFIPEDQHHLIWKFVKGLGHICNQNLSIILAGTEIPT